MLIIEEITKAHKTNGNYNFFLHFNTGERVKVQKRGDSSGELPKCVGLVTKARLNARQYIIVLETSEFSYQFMETEELVEILKKHSLLDV